MSAFLAKMHAASLIVYENFKYDCIIFYIELTFSSVVTPSTQTPSTTAAQSVCTDPDGNAMRKGDTWKVDCNTCTCGGSGDPVCTTRACPSMTPSSSSMTSSSTTNIPSPSSPLPCAHCTHCTNAIDNTFEEQLAIFEALIQRLDEDNEMLREGEKKLQAKVKELEAQNLNNTQIIVDLINQLARFQEGIRKLETENTNLKNDKHRLNAKIQDLEHENSERLKAVEELTSFKARIQKLGTVYKLLDSFLVDIQYPNLFHITYNI